MCGGGGGGGGNPPPVVERDPVAEQAEIDRKSTRKANQEIAYQRSRRRASSLISNTGGASGIYGGSVISQGSGGNNLGAN